MSATQSNARNHLIDRRIPTKAQPEDVRPSSRIELLDNPRKVARRTFNLRSASGQSYSIGIDWNTINGNGHAMQSGTIRSFQI